MLAGIVGKVARDFARLIKMGLCCNVVYVRICGAMNANHCVDRLYLILPLKGRIRALVLTEKWLDKRLILGMRSENEKTNVPKSCILFKRALILRDLCLENPSNFMQGTTPA